MEEIVEIFHSAKNILVAADEEYEKLVRRYEYLLDKQKKIEEECNSITEELKSLSELEEHWFSDKLGYAEPFSITGSCRKKENWISSFKTFEQFCKVVEDSSRDSSVLIEFVKELRSKKTKLNDEALLQYKISEQSEQEDIE